jgi:predicted DNA-binding transcriptional regulator AlpA
MSGDKIDGSGGAVVAQEAALCALGDRMAIHLAERLRNDPLVLPEYLNSKQAATLTGFSPKALERMRHRGEGPTYAKVGKSIRYAVADLRAWMEAGRVE